jgi:putative sterol carrier protein
VAGCRGTESGKKLFIDGAQWQAFAAGSLDGISGCLTRGLKFAVKQLIFALPVTEAQTFIFGPDIGHLE